MFLFHVFFGVWNADVLTAPNIILCLKEGVQTFALECKLGGVVFFFCVHVCIPWRNTSESETHSCVCESERMVSSEYCAVTCV